MGGYSVEMNNILKLFYHPNLAKLAEHFDAVELYFRFVETKTYF